MASEKNFENRLKGWLNSQGIYALGTAKNKMTVEPCGYYEKRWGGGQFSKSGLPDMHIVVNGISIEIELKAPNGRASELQKQKLSQIADSGAIGFVAYPDDFEKIKKLIMHIKEMTGISDALTYIQRLYDIERTHWG